MPSVSKDSAARVQEVPGVAHDHSDDIDGYTVSFTSFLGDVDGAPMLRGLPDDLCQCPHWGYVLRGRISFRFPDREETYETGEAFYVPPGHSPFTYADSEVVMFHPADELAATRDAMARNFAAAGADAR
jgi:hypothetical protein